MQISIELPDDDADAVGSALLPGSEEEERRAATRGFAQLAADELVAWLLGRERHRTLTDLQIARVSALFESTLVDEAPSKRRLYNDFNLPYGQAAYIARVLADRDLSHWREEARAELLGVLQRDEEDARRLDAAGDGATSRALTMSSLAWRELQTAFATAAEAQPTLDPPRLTNTVVDLRYVDVTASTIVALLDAHE